MYPSPETRSEFQGNIDPRASPTWPQKEVARHQLDLGHACVVGCLTLLSRPEMGYSFRLQRITTHQSFDRRFLNNDDALALSIRSAKGDSPALVVQRLCPLPGIRCSLAQAGFPAQELFGGLAYGIINTPAAKLFQKQFSLIVSFDKGSGFGRGKAAVEGAVGQGDQGRRKTMTAEVGALPGPVTGKVRDGLVQSRPLPGAATISLAIGANQDYWLAMQVGARGRVTSKYGRQVQRG